MTTTNETTNWRELLVFDGEGATGDTLGYLVDNAPSNLDEMTLGGDGSVSVWEGYTIAADGEVADWDTPRGAVNWSGFREALNR